MESLLTTMQTFEKHAPDRAVSRETAPTVGEDVAGSTGKPLTGSGGK
jgi:hypothetical protein